MNAEQFFTSASVAYSLLMIAFLLLALLVFRNSPKKHAKK